MLNLKSGQKHIVRRWVLKRLIADELGVSTHELVWFNGQLTNFHGGGPVSGAMKILKPHTESAKTRWRRSRRQKEKGN